MARLNICSILTGLRKGEAYLPLPAVSQDELCPQFYLLLSSLLDRLEPAGSHPSLSLPEATGGTELHRQEKDVWYPYVKYGG